MRISATTCALLAIVCIAKAELSASEMWDFNANNGGFTVSNTGPVEDPWTYNGGGGTWLTNGTQGQGVPTSSALISPNIVVGLSGPATLSFSHRYSFEFDTVRWDGGQVRLSVNGGAFNPVPNANFSSNGYVGIIQGNNALTGQDGFNGDSAGYGSGSFINSVASLGVFNAGDILNVQFLGAWDEFAEGTNPNWEITSVAVATATPEPATIGLWSLLGLVFLGVGWHRVKQQQ